MTLLNMPSIVLIKILGKCDFVSILSLRKTCKDLRNFIIDTKPQLSIDKIEVGGDSNSIQLFISCDAKENGDIIPIFYEKIKNDSCEITWGRFNGNRKRILKNEKFQNLFENDLKTIFSHSVTVMEELVIQNLEIRSLLEKQLAVKNISLWGYNQNQFLQVLQFISPESVMKIELHNNKGSFADYLEIDNLINMEQWKQARELNVFAFLILAPIQNLVHFNTVEFSLQRFTTDDFLLLKETFLTSPCQLKHFVLHSKKSIREEDLIKVFGRPSLKTLEDSRRERRWFFKHSIRPYWVVRVSTVDHLLEFEIIRTREVPEVV